MICSIMLNQGILKGEYHCTIDLLFDWFGISYMTTDNFCFYLQYRLSRPVKQEVNSTGILPPFVFPGSTNFAFQRGIRHNVRFNFSHSAASNTIARRQGDSSLLSRSKEH
jgi:hypothetical protein